MNSEDRDSLLIRLDERMQGLQKNFSNHLEHHFRYTLLAAGTALSAISALIIVILKLI